jgi:predicted RNase H-like nuclease
MVVRVDSGTLRAKRKYHRVGADGIRPALHLYPLTTPDCLPSIPAYHRLTTKNELVGLTMFVGADRCKAGWIAVVFDGDHWTVDVHLTTTALWRAYSHAGLILLDIPIGLRDSGSIERACDLAARRAIMPRHNSVFPAPCRQALTVLTYGEASNINDQITGRKLSKQSFAIMPTIREVDDLLASEPSARLTIREMHPEVCFWGLAGKRPMQHYKKDEAGFEERLEVLTNFYSPSADLIQHALTHFRSSILSRNDVVDALVGAITASAGSTHLYTLPDVPECDSRGLPMEMVYRS